MSDELTTREHWDNLLEIGCAYSRYMPVMRSRYGHRVSGIDYSPAGCSGTIAGREKKGIKLGGEILCGDSLDGPGDLAGKFDHVMSFGVVEHSSEPSKVLRPFADYLVPGGTIITALPDTSGLGFRLYRWLDRAIYDIHQILDERSLAQAHRGAGRVVGRCEHMGVFNAGVLTSARASLGNRVVIRAPLRTQQAAHFAFDKLDWYPDSSLMSPYIVCLARKRS